MQTIQLHSVHSPTQWPSVRVCTFELTVFTPHLCSALFQSQEEVLTITLTADIHHRLNSFTLCHPLTSIRSCYTWKCSKTNVVSGQGLKRQLFFYSWDDAVIPRWEKNTSKKQNTCWSEGLDVDLIWISWKVNSFVSVYVCVHVHVHKKAWHCFPTVDEDQRVGAHTGSKVSWECEPWGISSAVHQPISHF